MNKTAAVFGAVWGVFAMVFSLFLFLVIFAPETLRSSDFAPFANSVLAYYDGALFGAEAWAIGVGAFGLGALGLIGAGLVRQWHIIAGIFLLISTVGMLILCFQPFLVGEYSVITDSGFFEYGLPKQILAVLLTVLFTLLGFLGSLFSLAARPKLSVPRPAAQTAAAPAAPAPAPAPAPVVPPMPGEPDAPLEAQTAQDAADRPSSLPGGDVAE